MSPAFQNPSEVDSFWLLPKANSKLLTTPCCSGAWSALSEENEDVGVLEFTSLGIQDRLG